MLLIELVHFIKNKGTVDTQQLLLMFSVSRTLLQQMLDNLCDEKIIIKVDTSASACCSKRDQCSGCHWDLYAYNK